MAVEPKATIAADPAADNQQEVLEKYDKESVVRQFASKKIVWFVTLLAVAYSLFHLYITFNPMPQLQQRAIHVAIGVALLKSRQPQ